MNNAGLKNIFSFYRRKSTLIVLFIIFVVFYAIFDFIIRKTDVHIECKSDFTSGYRKSVGNSHISL